MTSGLIRAPYQVAGPELLLAELGLFANKLARSFANLISYFSKDSELVIHRDSRRVLEALVPFFPSPGNTGHDSLALSQTVKT